MWFTTFGNIYTPSPSFLRYSLGLQVDSCLKLIAAVAFNPAEVWCQNGLQQVLLVNDGNKRPWFVPSERRAPCFTVLDVSREGI